MNMIELNTNLFKRLYQAAYGTSDRRFHACISTEVADKEIIRSARDAACFQSLSLKIAVITCTDETLILAIQGRHNIGELPPELRFQRLDESAGLLTILGGVGFLSVTTPEALLDKDWAQIEDAAKGSVDDLSYVNVDEVLDVLEEFSIYEVIERPFEFSKDNVDRFLLMLLMVLDIGDSDKLEVKAELMSLVLTLDKFPFHLLHAAYISQTWQYSYIDLYRCVELLYPIPKMIKLRSALGKRGVDMDLSQIRAIDFFEDVNNATGWRENEQLGLDLLVSESSDRCVTTIFDMLLKAKLVKSEDTEIIKELSKSELMRDGNFKGILEQARDLLTSLSPADMPLITKYKLQKCAFLISKVLYVTRNELVHFRSHKQVQSEDKIKASFKALVILINDIFHKHQTEAYS